MSEPPAILRYGEREFELPTVVGTEGERGLDISKLRAGTGYVTLDNGFVNTASCESAITFIDGEAGILRYRGIDIEELVSVPIPSFLETLVPARSTASCPPQAQRDEFSQGIRKHTLVHEDVKRFFDGFPEGRAPDGHAVVGRHRPVDLLPGQPRPQGPRGSAALDHPADGEAADDRGLRVQEVDRPAVRLPEQQARPHRELPHDDVLGAVGAVRGEPRRSSPR